MIEMLYNWRLHKQRYQKPTKNGNQNNGNNIHNESRVCHLFEFDMTARKCDSIWWSTHRQHTRAARRHGHRDT